MNFGDLGVMKRLVDVMSTKRFLLPTDIQQRVIPLALEGQSLLVSSQTGSGKTLAYILPMVQLISQRDGAHGVVLVPTRELAEQVGEVCREVCCAAGLRCAVIYGGVDYAPQIEALAESVQIVVATPGRLMDLRERGVIGFDRADYFVLDEVDQMLDLGFREAITSLSTICSSVAQKLCFSATIPDGVIEVVEGLAADAVRVEMEMQPMAVESIEQRAYFVNREMMDALLLHLLRRETPSQAVVFTRSRKMADRIAQLLCDNGISAEAMHSDRSQSARQYILDRFRRGETALLVATDVIARGIDIDSITHVFNYGLPHSAEQYIHRIGRTGRAGRCGNALSLCEVSDREMLGTICKMMRRNIPIERNHPYMTQDVGQSLDGTAVVKKGKKSKKR